MKSKKLEGGKGSPWTTVQGGLSFRSYEYACILVCYSKASGLFYLDFPSECTLVDFMERIKKGGVLPFFIHRKSVTFKDVSGQPINETPMPMFGTEYQFLFAENIKAGNFKRFFELFERRHIENL